MRGFIKKKRKKGFTLIEMMISIFIFALMMTAVAGIFARHIIAYKQTRLMANDLENAQFALNYLAKTLRTASIVGSGTGLAKGSTLIDRDQNGYGDDFWSTPIGEGTVSGGNVGAEDGLIIYDFSQEACMLFIFRDETYSEDYPHPALWVEMQTGIVGVDNIEECLDPTNWDRGGANNASDICKETSDCQYREERLTTGSVKGSFEAAPTRYMDHVGSRSTDTMGRATIAMQVI
ncbi:MAG: prepilin-type N-terminal cleavage/methylation domain-containing protein, partial [Patescibacteria group bacterium]